MLQNLSDILAFLQRNVFGRYTVTSTYRPDSFGYHRLNLAVDIVPDWFLTNLLILHLIWPGGLGYDPRPHNRHIHLDLGPKRRWREPNDQIF